jgi:mono/diheme cytochrome c family protein
MAEAEAIASFLSSLQEPITPSAVADPNDEEIGAGAKLFQSLLCVRCHIPPEDSVEQRGASTRTNDPEKLSLAHVNAKFRGANLQQFLLEPERHYGWIRMPNFRLTGGEANQLAGYLRKHASRSGPANPRNDPEVAARGQMLVQSRGCLNCHGLKLDNTYTALTLAELPRDAADAGCLAIEPDPVSTAPRFAFSPGEREALGAFLKTDRASLQRHIPSEFTERQTKVSNCAACHAQPEGFPTLDQIGSKLRPEWIRDFVGRDVGYKPRPWLAARMPKFNVLAAPLAHGFSTLSGFAPASAAEAPPDAAAAEMGRKLVRKEGGFSCVACHAIGTMRAAEVFESEGINLRYTAERLRYPYFQRWLRDPLSIDPRTKMPDYFDGDASPLTEYYQGDARRQIEALWNYFKLGPKMPLPDVGGAQ